MWNRRVGASRLALQSWMRHARKPSQQDEGIKSYLQTLDRPRASLQTCNFARGRLLFRGALAIAGKWQWSAVPAAVGNAGPKLPSWWVIELLSWAATVGKGCRSCIGNVCRQSQNPSPSAGLGGTEPCSRLSQQAQASSGFCRELF